MSGSALIIAIVGIAVSGVVGPWLNAWVTRKANRQQFDQDRAGAVRDDLAKLVDESAELFAVGATMLRLDAEAKRAGHPTPPTVAEWTGKVFPLQQRLRLRIPADDPIVRGYDNVRQHLVDLAKDAPDATTLEAAVQAFESARDQYLDDARAQLEAPVEISGRDRSRLLARG
jgi:hypothetical protein